VYDHRFFENFSLQAGMAQRRGLPNFLTNPRTRVCVRVRADRVQKSEKMQIL
jgi:hypothetical protein